jgi:GntR family transcriptional regulator
MTCMDKMANDGQVTALPLHRMISDELRRQIVAGELGPGDQLPSEHELMRRFGVSRGTIRQARANLRGDGTISGSQGRRLAVNRPPLTQPLSELISFHAWAESLGKRPSALVIESGFATADGETAAALEIHPGDQVFWVVRVRLADDVPLMIERTAFTKELGRHLGEIDLARQSIYAELSNRGVTVHSARQVLSAESARRTDARHLGLPVGAPLLRVRRIGFSSTGQPLEWSDDRYHGDQVIFAIENSAIVSGVVRRIEPPGGS